MSLEHAAHQRSSISGAVSSASPTRLSTARSWVGSASAKKRAVLVRRNPHLQGPGPLGLAPCLRTVSVVRSLDACE